MKDYADNKNKEGKNSKAKQNYHKSGKKAARKEQRRLEAIDRAYGRVLKAEDNAKRAKNKTQAQIKIIRANLNLQQTRGGRPHADLAKEFAPQFEALKPK